MNKLIEKTKEIRPLLYYLESIDIEYRNTLNLPNELTFGVEIEFDRLRYETVEYLFLEHLLPSFLTGKYYKKNEEEYKTWIYTEEQTIDPYYGCEIDSSILIDDKKCWNELRIMCNDLKNFNAKISPKCAGHIHIGSHILTKYEDYETLIKIWLVYEPIIYRFGYGMDTKPRESIHRFARSMNYKPLKEIDKVKKDKFFLYEILNILCYIENDDYNRNYGINLLNINPEIGFDYRNTIEFRNPNGTLEPNIWQNNVNFFSKMLLAIANNKIDLDYLNYRFHNLASNHNIDSFNNIHIKDAIELSDIIFDDELDKMYFLKQYFKLFEGVRLPKKLQKIMK